jgi:hypothetical protein
MASPFFRTLIHAYYRLADPKRRKVAGENPFTAAQLCVRYGLPNGTLPGGGVIIAADPKIAVALAATGAPGVEAQERIVGRHSRVSQSSGAG